MGNVYGGLGFVWLRYLIMALGTIFIICYILKIAMFSGTCMKEYDMTIPASLYGAFSMGSIASTLSFLRSSMRLEK